ncbi:amidase [Horticoccus sp. 23ND18S-11]|uniref:amidase n=1 Tax=Horticoccus sp. 23ND18S-11 TaxID=3391832 RepID=UPI0039C91FC5
MRTFSPSTSRRDFLGKLGVGSTGAMLAALPALTFAEGAPPKASSSWLTSSDPSEDILWMSSTKLAQMIRQKKISARDAVEACIKRIEQVNPKLNAVVQTCFDRARTEAKAADEALAAGRIMGPLHGVPFTIKDSLDTAGVISTGGTVGRQAYIPPEDATVVARVRAAGAILLGKTNTPEFTLAGGGIPGVGTTANIIYGISKNPWDLKRSTAGSSGGAGAIVAAGGASFDIGSDYGGSIRMPAHNNGTCGLKPTFGRVPRTGHIVDFGGIFDSWQEIGPLTRRVEDLNLITGLICGPDYKDAAMIPIPWRDPAGVEVKGLRVGFYAENGVAEITPETVAIVKKAAAYFSELGCPVKEDFPKAIIMELEEIRAKLSPCSGASLLRLAEKSGTKAISPTIVTRAKQEMPSTAELTELLEKQDANRSKLLGWMKNYDIVINPVMPKPAQLINIGEQPNARRPGSSYMGVHNTSGYPSAVVPAGFSPEGLPIGVQIIGQPWTEDKVLAAAAFVESKTGGWRKPPV